MLCHDQLLRDLATQWRHFFANDATIFCSRRQRVYQPGHLSRRACFGICSFWGAAILRGGERVSLGNATGFSRPGDFCGIEFFFIDNATDSRRKRSIRRRSRRLRPAAVSDGGYRTWGALLLVRGCRLSCARFLNLCHDFADFYFLTFGSFRFEHAIGFGNDFSRNFVVLESKEGVAFLYLLA